MVAAPSDFGNVDEIMEKVGFNHPVTYKEIHEGAGSEPMHEGARAFKEDIATRLQNATQLLDDANREANVAWEGKAAEQHGNSLKPMTSFLATTQVTSVAAGDSVERQVNAFTTVRDGMPEPKEVTATDSLLEKGGAWLVGSETDLQQQEREATEAAEAAKQTYETYGGAVQAEVQNPPRFDPPPTQNGDGGQSSFDRSGAINSPMGVGAGGSPGAGGGTAGIGGGSGAGFGPGGSGPSGSGSSWSPGGGGAGGSLPGGIGVPGGPGAGSGPGAGGVGGIGGGFLPGGPGGTGGAGSGGRSGLGAGGAGGRAGSGGAGAGGRAGVGAGANQPGAGGRAGVGTPGAGGAAGGAGTGAAGAGGRGGAGAMGAGGAGRGAKGAGDEDQEHESWLEEQDDVWLNDMPRTAPPVFGE
ncbi:PPE domain-containing protein [Saccharopolyspora sp. NPDC047091]|uniref:PPE domain-containing protein n=1 Tax=Saccharopolyspora sp. NPDC047091 TaxID=3155924 RepID=UPI0033D259C1